MTTPRIESMAAYMRARHNIYLKRLAGWPGPWTDDPILAGGRFCNIFRELDTVTRWIEVNIRQPFAHHPNLWFMLAIARYINWPPTLEFLIREGYWPTDDSWTPERLTAGLEARAATGVKTYTGAYMIRAESDPKAPWYSWSKHRYIAEIVLGRLWEDREMWQDSLDYGNQNARTDDGVQLMLKQVWEWFQSHHYIGWGPFMAYEVVTDLRHTRYLRDAPDIMTWANAGPGAIRGLNRLYGRELNQQPKRAQTNEEMWLLMTELNADPALWPAKWPRLEMRDVEHTLCEWDKMERVRLGQGKMRSKYDWRKATPLS